MQREKDFLKRRIEEAVFVFRLLKRYSEKMPGDSLTVSLCEEYKKKYLHLMKEYVRLFGEECHVEDFSWDE